MSSDIIHKKWCRTAGLASAALCVWRLAGERTTLGLAGGVGVLLLAAVDASVFARISVAAAGSGGVLIWRARRLRAQAQSSLQSYPIAVAD